MVENAVQQGLGASQHLGEFGPIVRLQQRVQETVDFFRIDFGNAIDGVGSEIAINHSDLQDRVQVEINFLMRACALPPRILPAAALKRNSLFTAERNCPKTLPL